MNDTKKKCCVIDIGTNSIRMLIAEINNNSIIVIKKDMEMTRIGKGVDETGLLSPEGIDATINALKKFRDKAKEEDIKTINAIATSAVRDAKNKREFIHRVKEETDIDVEVISGVREAELGFKGIVGGIESRGTILAIDIGGGSTELILGDSNGIEYSTSVNIGAVRLTDKFVTTDPTSMEEVHNMDMYIKEQLKNPLEIIKKNSIDKVVGIGGTITTLSAIKQEMTKYEGNKIHNSILTIEDIEKIIKKLLSLTNEERREIKGLQPKRADIIFAGTEILYNILKLLSKTEIMVSDYDNLEGYVFDKLDK